MKSFYELRIFKGRMKRNPTKSEFIFRKRLEELGIDFKTQLVCGFYIVDFVIPERMLCIEIDGYSHKDTVEYDERRDDFLRKVGFSVVRIMNEDAKTIDLGFIEKYNKQLPYKFRSALSKGNVERGRTIESMRKRGIKI